MVRGAYIFLALVTSFPAVAEMTSITALLAPAMFGIANRNTDPDFAKFLKLDPRGTVLIHNPKTHSSCTTRFLSSSTALLAAHCLRLEESSGVMNVEGVDSLAYYKLDGYPKDKTQDIALVVFPEGTAEFLGITRFPELAAEAQESGKAYVEGWGKEREFTSPSESGTGVKGWGEFEITGRKEGLLQTESVKLPKRGDKENEKGRRVVGLSGDSGASVFNAKGEVVAILTRRIIDTIETKVRLPILEFGFFPTGDYEERLMQIPDGIHNELVDVTSATSRELFRKAILCTEGACASNFPGSGVAESEASLGRALGPVDTKYFSHRTLRTGRYFSSIGADDTLVVSLYDGNRLRAVRLRAIHGDDISQAMTFDCAEGVCTMPFLRGVSVVTDDNDTFLFRTGEPEEAENRYLPVAE